MNLWSHITICSVTYKKCCVFIKDVLYIYISKIQEGAFQFFSVL